MFYGLTVEKELINLENLVGFVLVMLFHYYNICFLVFFFNFLFHVKL